MNSLKLNNTLLSGLVAISSDVSNTSTNNGVPPTITKNFCKMTNEKPEITSKNVAEAREVLKKSNIVCFDVDSTVILEEGIDELALFCGKGPEVAALTKEAMGGHMTFQEALKKRLDIIRPSQKQIREFLLTHPSTITTGLRELISKLREYNMEIYLISGGFDCLIEPVAESLDIPLENLFTNKLFFNFNGSYAGFDTNQVTSMSGGKGEAIKLIKQRYTNNMKITMIGDGATDLEACPPADYFIGE